MTTDRFRFSKVAFGLGPPKVRQYCNWLFISVLIGAFLGWDANALAAKKYYPPGFSPPSDAMLAPNAQGPNNIPPAHPTPPGLDKPTAPSVPADAVSRTGPVQQQIIIKTVPAAAVKPRPRDPLLMLIDDHRYTEALHLIDKRIKKTPNDLNLRLLRARILSARKNYENALEAYQFILDKTKNDKAKSVPVQITALTGMAGTLLLQAQQSHQQGDIASSQTQERNAENTFKKVLRLDRNDLAAWVGLAQIALMDGKITDAQQAMRHVLDQPAFENNAAALLTQAKILLALNRAQEALPPAFKSKQLSPYNTEVYLTLAQIYSALGRPDDAIIQLQSGMDKAPGNIMALKLLSSAYQAKMRPEDAETTLQKAVSLDPSDTEATLALVKIYQARQENDRATLLLMNLAQQQPQNLAVRNQLLQLYAQQSKWAEVSNQTEPVLQTYLHQPTGWASMPHLASNKDLQTFLSYATEAFYLKHKADIDPGVWQQASPGKDLLQYYRLSPPTLQNQRNLLLLDPLSPVEQPGVQVSLFDDLKRAIQLSYLKGDAPAHQKLLMRLTALNGLTAQALIAFIQCALILDDYTGAHTALAKLSAVDAKNPETATLQNQVVSNQQTYLSQLNAFKVIVKKLPPEYWQIIAQNLLRLGHGDGALYSALADGYQRAHQDKLALYYTQMAAQYAPTADEKQRRLKQVTKLQARRN